MTLDPSEHWAYRLTDWVLHHGHELLPLFWGAWTVLLVAAVALLWFRQGARDLWAWRQWRRAWGWWRRRGGGGGHSDRYEAVMQSAGWRRRRSQAIRRAGRRCQECGARGPLDVHHLSYSDLGRERPWQLAALCKRCHLAAHGKGGAVA